MTLTLYNVFKASLLIANGVAVLHPRRFLSLYGYDRVDVEGSAFKNQIVGLLQAVGYLKVPLIATNTLVIFIEMIAAAVCPANRSREGQEDIKKWKNSLERE